MKEMVGGCCVCSDDRGWSENPLVYCDGQFCTVAVHQACYGIVTVPTGPWFCRKCESQERSVKVKCELCPSKYGALKRTDNSGWAHVVCALYIPEVRFGNVTTMEPIQLQLIPAERFNKVCYICEEKGKPANATVGACMQCNKFGCKHQFHVTCAQGLGLLCEEAGNYFDNVKYCGYCQHHYSKLKKGGNVKTIPPYKPVANEAHNSDSNSEKEPDTGAANFKNNTSPPGNKKRSSAGGKAANAKNSAKSNSQHKVVHNSRSSDKNKVSNSKSAKGDDSVAAAEPNAEPGKDKKDSKSESVDSEKDVTKDVKIGKKRKVNSRTPTPVSASVSSEVSVVVTAVSSAAAGTGSANPANSGDKKGAGGDIGSDKIKKPKVDSTQSIVSNQPVVALTSIQTNKSSSPTVIDSTANLEAPAQPVATIQATPPSLVVSVPLVNTNLSPHHTLVSNQASSAAPAAGATAPERGASVVGGERMSVIGGEIISGANSNPAGLASEMSAGGLKIGYEKQVAAMNTEEDMELELEPSRATIVEEPVTRLRSHSQSNDKMERSSRSKKRNAQNSSNSNPAPPTASTQKRSSRAQHVSPSPERPGAFAAVSQGQVKDIKESPPRSPDGEEASTSRGRPKGRKSAPAAMGEGSSKDSKDIKMFQNGLVAPHMLGNTLNPTSKMHEKMNDHLTSEVEAHSVFNPNEINPNLIGPPLHHKVVQSARASSTGSSTASGSSGLSSMLSGSGGTIPQTLDQLLERQWEQGSQFLMEQAQHFDIASLLSCLHQLRAENLRLEEHVGSLLQRRDHLLAVNARLAIPLTGQPAVGQPSQTPNNIHPSVAAAHEDLPRPHGRSSSGGSRYSGGADASAAAPAVHEDVSRPSHSRSSSSSRYTPGPTQQQHSVIDNGLPEGYPQQGGSQQSSSVRHSPVGSYQSSGMHRQSTESGGGRSASRSQSYQMYDRPGPSSSQQVVMRDRSERESDLHHLGSSKPS